MLVFVVLAIAGGLLTVIDLAEERLPDAIVLPMIPITLLLFTVAAAVTGEWWSLLRAIEAGAVLFAFVFVMMIFSPDLGFGDVKLACHHRGLLRLVRLGCGAVGFAAAWMTFAVIGVGADRDQEAQGHVVRLRPVPDLRAVLGVFWAGCSCPGEGSGPFDRLIELQRPPGGLVAARPAGHEDVTVGVLHHWSLTDRATGRRSHQARGCQRRSPARPATP